jgi:type VI secretion system secreted protein VgrG
MPYTQENRPLQLTTPLGKDVLLLESFKGVESISGLFQFELELLTEGPNLSKVEFDKILGQPVTLKLIPRAGTSRFFSGIVARMSEGHQIFSKKGSVDFYRYRALMVPKLWLLTRTVRSRIFQQQTVKEILKKALTGLDLDDSQIQGKFDPREYCVQYRESDFNFASRLMEEEGLYYYFVHDEGSHKLVLANAARSHPDIPGEKKLKYRQTSTEIEDEESVFSWDKTQEIRSGKYTLWDHCFQLPIKNHLQSTQNILVAVRAGEETQKLKVGGNEGFEIYDFPGGYSHRYDGIKPGGEEDAGATKKINPDGDRTVRLRMEEEAAAGLLIEGKGNCSRFASGHKFTLSKHFGKADGEYMITRVEHRATIAGTYTGESSGSLGYTNEFQCIPTSLQYRHPRVTPKPRVEGAQTALVVGAEGKEIEPDKYGRVKVQFLWDRDGQYNTSSSCWVRVATPWAGQKWGMIHIPRIGHEVIVDFLQGDPDQPVIIGSLFNSENEPPYKLPDNATQSGIKTRSSLKGTDTNFNELRFEDKKGSEEVYFHAERDFKRVVENNDSLDVGSDDQKTCPDGSQTITIYKDRKTTVKTGDETLTVEKGNRTVTVSEKNEKLEVSKGTRDVIVEKDDTHQVKSGNCIVNVDSQNYQLKVQKGKMTCEAAQAIELKVGQSTITMLPSSIELKIGNSSIKMDPTSIALATGMSGITYVKLGPQGVDVAGMKVGLTAKTMLQLQGLMVKAEASAMATLKGGMVMIN